MLFNLRRLAREFLQHLKSFCAYRLSFSTASTLRGRSMRAACIRVIKVDSLEVGEFVRLAGTVYRGGPRLFNELAAFAAEIVSLDIWPLARRAQYR